jgi:hypothetical protein
MEQTSMRASGADEARRLILPRRLGLEQTTESINGDELVEMTLRFMRSSQGRTRGQHAAPEERSELGVSLMRRFRRIPRCHDTPREASGSSFIAWRRPRV